MLIPMGFLAASGAGAAPAYELIESTVLGSNTTSITFNTSGLGVTYKHLQLRIVANTTGTSGNNSLLGLRFNSDTGSNYRVHYLRGYTAGIQSAAFNIDTRAYVGLTGTNFNSSSAFGSSIIDIADAFSTTKNKTIKSLTGVHAYSSPHYIGLYSGLWLSTAAITSINISTYDPSFTTNSRFSLYGIKGA